MAVTQAEGWKGETQFCWRGTGDILPRHAAGHRVRLKHTHTYTQARTPTHTRLQDSVETKTPIAQEEQSVPNRLFPLHRVASRRF